MKKVMVFLLAAFGLAACRPGGIDLRPDALSPEEAAAKLTAEAAAARGSYAALKDACRIYEDLSRRPAVRKSIATDYFRAAFLLGLREKELGINSSGAFELAGRLVEENPSLSGFRLWPVAAAEISLRIKGVVGDSIPWLDRAVSEEDSERLLADLLARAPTDELAAYFFLAMSCPGMSAFDKVENRAALRAAHSQSILINFRTAFCPELIAERFEAVIQADPEFWEAYGFRAETALGRGALLAAEKDLLIATAHIPESASFFALLAGVYFYTEEFEESIQACEKAIALFPEYRDAYLTKAICLSQLGRYADAILVLQRIIDLKYYLQGEAFYWLAWNHHALGDLEKSGGFIESAKGPLPTNTQVFSLAGTIALERGDLDRAEKDFQEALVYNSGNDEALLGLARIAERRGLWPEAAGFYEKTITVMDANEEALKAKIEEIKTADLVESRRAKMLSAKEAQLRVSETVEAASCFNAAAAWANAGKLEAARALAGRAAEHPQFSERAAELLDKIK